MKVHRSVEDIPPITNPVLTIGTFDGVHLGHQKIIRFLKENARRLDGETVLLTFHPHPRIVLHPDDHNLELIQRLDDRIEQLEKFGVDHLILFPFTREFSRMSATEFVRNILVNKIGVKMMTIGYNHHFGRNREGNLELLKELSNTYNFQVEEIPALRIGDKSVSSTKIRRALSEGNIRAANNYLGRIFFFKGKVISGNQLGSKIGFPTANLKPCGEFQLVPKTGVYAVRAGFEGKIYDGMCNIGYRPTVNTDGNQHIELHIFNFKDQIYDKTVDLYFVDRVRDEVKFDSVEKLKDQLKNDETRCKTILADHPAG